NSALPDLSRSVKIQGPGAANLVVAAAVALNPAYRVFQVDAGATVTISDVGLLATRPSAPLDKGGVINNAGTLTLNNSTIYGGVVDDKGGGIYNSGSLTLNNCLVISNLSSLGGGIYNAGSLTLNDTEISHNATVGVGGSLSGGGIYNEAGATATVISTTVSSNESDLRGGGIINDGTMTL